MHSRTSGCAAKWCESNDRHPRPHRKAPWWAWKVGTCSVSDDAWFVPDFNSPEHGERLKRELSYDTMAAGDTWDVGIDIDQRPAGRPALALLIAFLEAKMEMENGNGN